MMIRIDSKEKRSWACEMVRNIRGDEDMQVTIEPYVEVKSDPQRAWFHVLCREICNGTGYTEAQIKEAVKKMILGTKTVKLGGYELEVTCSSETDEEGKPRSKPSYSELIEGAYMLGAEAMIQLPSPMRQAG
jgi:hypothetical protein